MTLPVVIAADLGASSGKLAKGYFNGDKLIVSDIKSFPNLVINIGKAQYWNIFSIYQNILDLIAYYSENGNNIRSFGIDTWGASYGLLDKKGRLLEPIYHYRDIRTLGIESKMYEVMDKKDIFKLTGCQCNRTYTLPQLVSYISEENKILDNAYSMLFLPDLIDYFLTGTISTERSIAGTSALFEKNQKGWSEEIINGYNLPRNLFGRIESSGSYKGNFLDNVEKYTNTNSTKVYSTVSHDTASAVTAIPNFGKNKLYISIGTNISMGIENDNSIVTDLAYNGGFKNTGGFGDTKIMYRDFSSGWLVNEFRRICLTEGTSYTFEDLELLAKKKVNKESFIDVEHFSFNLVGMNIKENINEYLLNTGQTPLSEDFEFIRCIFMSIALKVKYCFYYINSEMNIPIEDIYVINGGAQNTVLVQMICDALKQPVKVGLLYATLAGNILTQLYAQKEIKDLSEIRDVSTRSFELNEMNPKKSNWDEYFDEMIEKKVCN